MRLYRSQHGGHELVRLLSLHEASHFKHTNRQAGYDGRMLSQRLLQHLAVLVIVLQRSYFRYAAKALECSQVRLVNMGEMGVGDDDIWEGLDIAQTVRKPECA
jgi:hypothetical protein